MAFSGEHGQHSLARKGNDCISLVTLFVSSHTILSRVKIIATSTPSGKNCNKHFKAEAVLARLAEKLVYGAHAVPDVASAPVLLSEPLGDLPHISEGVLVRLLDLDAGVFVLSFLQMLAEFLQCCLKELLPVLRLFEVVIAIPTISPPVSIFRLMIKGL